MSHQTQEMDRIGTRDGGMKKNDPAQVREHTEYQDKHSSPRSVVTQGKDATLGYAASKAWATLGAVKNNKRKVAIAGGVILGAIAGAYLIRGILKRRAGE